MFVVRLTGGRCHQNDTSSGSSGFSEYGPDTARTRRTGPAACGPSTKGHTIIPEDVQRDETLAMFRRMRALLEGHFRLSSGLHSAGYLQCALVLQDPREAGVLGEALAAAVTDLRPGVVLSPALGGVIIGHEVARALGVRALFAERTAPPEAALALRRGFTLAPGERVLVVEDVLTTGGSTRETMELARALGASVVGAAAIVDRSGGAADLDVPFRALLTLSLPAYDAGACPLCAQGLPVTKPGSRPA